jgi:hypothetical protein
MLFRHISIENISNKLILSAESALRSLIYNHFFCVQIYQKLDLLQKDKKQLLQKFEGHL